MFARKSLIYISLRFIISFLNILFFYFAVRNYLSSEFGYFRVAVSLFAFFSFFANINLSTAHIKYIPEEKYQLNQYFSAFGFLKIMLLIFCSVIFYFVFAVQLEIGIIETNSVQIQIIIIVFINSIIFQISHIYISTFLGLLNIAKHEIVIFSGKILETIIGYIAVFFLEDFIFYVLSFTVGNILTLALCIYFGRNFRFVKPKKDLIKQYIRFSIYLILPALITLFIENFGVFVFLKYYDESLLGVYHVIINILIIINIIWMSFRILLVPEYSRLFITNQINQLNNKIYIFEKYMILFSFGLIITGFIIGPFLIDFLFGHYYLENGLLLFKVLLISTFSWGFLTPYLTLALITKDIKIIILINED